MYFEANYEKNKKERIKVWYEYGLTIGFLPHTD